MARKSNGVMLALAAACGLVAVATAPADARNETTMLNIDQVLNSADGKSQLDPAIATKLTKPTAIEGCSFMRIS